MKDRIKKIMESQHMAQQTFAQFIEKSPATLSSIFNGRTRPTLDIVEAIKNKLPNVSIDWLMFGRGPMYLDDSKPDQDHVQESPATPQNLAFEFSDSPSTPSGDSSVRSSRQSVDFTPKNFDKNVVKFIDKTYRKITEIRVFYDDQTWESFVPKTSK